MDDDVRAPIPVRQMNLMDPLGSESLEHYIDRINRDNTIDPEMKKILIKSRKEYMGLDDSPVDSSVFSNQLIVRAGKFCKFTSVLSKNIQLKIKILGRVNDFLSLKLDKIRLEPAEYLETIELVENNDMGSSNLEYIKSVVIPIDINALEEYKLIIELSKKEEADRIAKNLEIETRQNIVSVFMQYINRLQKFDKQIELLYQELEPSINNYTSLQTEKVIFEPDTFVKYNKFIGSVRIKPEHQEMFTSLFVVKT